MVLPVVLAGGVGSRLWPLSRAHSPKQFARLPGRASSLFQETLLRLKTIPGAEQPLVICNQAHRFLVVEQLGELSQQGVTLLLEPEEGRNTAAAIALACLQATSAGADPLVLALPSDHKIQDQDAFSKAVQAGSALAENGYLVIFGVNPQEPETGYGYIECGEALSGQGAWRVSKFIEKPDRELAEDLIESNRYLWNSGLFLFRASVYLNQLNQFAPDIYSVCVESFKATPSHVDLMTIPAQPFLKCRSESIDFAVMEKTEKAAVVSFDAGWSDLGSWNGVWKAQDKDINGNLISGDVLASDVTGSLIHAESRLVAAVGLQDVVIIETADAILVTGKDYLQSIKNLVQQITVANRREALDHVRVKRPWGHYESILHSNSFQCRYLVVSPGATPFEKRCCHTIEQWFMIKGTASISLSHSSFSLVAGESALLPAGSPHQLCNETDAPVELLIVRPEETNRDDGDNQTNEMAPPQQQEWNFY